MPTSPRFPIDAKSVQDAVELTSSLRDRHFKVLHPPQSLILSSGPDYKSVEYARGLFTEPLKMISRDIPMADVLSDVQDLGVLAAYSQLTDGLMTVLHTGENGIVVPVLPQVGLLENYQRIGWPFDSTQSNWFRRKFFQNSFDRSALEEVPLEKAQESFFSGLESFLAARIGGVRWWRSRGSGSGGGSGGSGTSSAQMWKVHTDAQGLSLAYHGTHAARLPMALPGGLTTPVDVYLPMGTLYLGANAGAGGAFKFDYGVVLIVPSAHPNPVHITKAF